MDQARIHPSRPPVNVTAVFLSTFLWFRATMHSIQVDVMSFWGPCNKNTTFYQIQILTLLTTVGNKHSTQPSVRHTFSLPVSFQLMWVQILGTNTTHRWHCCQDLICFSLTYDMAGNRNNCHDRRVNVAKKAQPKCNVCKHHHYSCKPISQAIMKHNNGT